jgi:hypothetical protein
MWNFKFLFQRPLWRSWKQMDLTCHNLKGSSLIMFKQIGMMFTSLVEKLLFAIKIIVCDYYSCKQQLQMTYLSYKWLIAKGNFSTNALCLVHKKSLPNHCTTKKELVFSIGFNPWKFTLIGLFNCDNGRQNIWKSTKTIRIPKKIDEKM